jgi:outer membrane lipoprotein SlyB
MRREADDRASVTVLMSVVVALLAVVGFAAAKLGSEALASARADDAADAVALAGALGDNATAWSFAKRHGATLVSFVDEGDEVVVVVETGGRRVRARAHRLRQAQPILVEFDAREEELR